MNPWQKHVNKMYIDGQYPEPPEPGKWPDEQSKQLAIKLIQEEVVDELIPAIMSDDLVEILDGAADAVWVILWAVRVLGFDLTPFFEEVARTNHAKIPATGPIRHPVTNKLQKPPGWEPPRIKEMLEEILERQRRVREGAHTCTAECEDVG
jgi:predicted HAD superfamily Cof-like phosphohydrolase